jgi:hypothetical protein
MAFEQVEAISRPAQVRQVSADRGYTWEAGSNGSSPARGRIVVARRRALRLVSYVGYLFVVVGVFCLFMRYAYTGSTDSARWADTQWGLLVFGAGFLVAGIMLVLGTHCWVHLVRADERGSRSTQMPQ